ncbi:MAG: mechanosensitive ion channel family protein [Gammaproteobacteria bacterium]|nr:mechanosensitive ion channel family protein [Gammaproteobacteria bacterium]
MLELLNDWILSLGVNENVAFYTTRAVAALAVVILSIAANFVAKRYVLSSLSYIIARTRSKWDDAVLRQRALDHLTHLAPALVIFVLAPFALEGMESTAAFIRNAAQIYMIIVLMLALDAVLNAAEDIYRTFEASKEIPIKGFIQVLKIVLYFLTIVLLISILLNKSPLFLLSGLGALAAVLMLVFRDSILGFVAGIQLAANRMVSVGDWIEMPRYGADGDVLEVALTTVKVQNWDKTITTIPTYALISESFKNWRGMSESGGRRIKRAVNIDMSSIRFCTEEMLGRFEKIQYIAAYIDTMKKELAEFNKAANVDHASLANGRRMTNIGTFRAYVRAYLLNHPMINKQMTFLVRQLPPTEYGLPIEIYVFSKDQVWANYEAIQADIFDHILAVVPEFDLRVFQNPGGSDFHKLVQATTAD